MDIQEWELLSPDGFLDFHGDGEVKLCSPKRNHQSKSVLDGYFRCPSPDSWSTRSRSRSQNQFVSVPVGLQLDLETKTMKDGDPDGEEAKEVIKLPVGEPEPVNPAKTGGFGLEAIVGSEDQDTLSHVSFQKVKEANKFVDTKLDSSPRGIVPPIEAFCFVDADDADEKVMERPCSPMKKLGKRGRVTEMDRGDRVSWEESKGGLKMWKWGLGGIGALCSVGVVAAATCCILILGSRQNHSKHNVRFQIYADDKRIKQVVHHATKLNEAISAARGVPTAGAHITFGGYYDGL